MYTDNKSGYYQSPWYWREPNMNNYVFTADGVDYVPTIQCHRCRTTFAKGMFEDKAPAGKDEVIVAAHLDGWYVTEDDKYCLACCQQMAERMNEHIENVRKIQNSRED